jgi:hypothetical protein
MRTQAMDPHKRTLRFPFFEYVAFSKPCGRTAMMRFASSILIYPRICGGQPIAKILLRFVTYEAVSASAPRNGNIGDYERSILFTSTAIFFITTRGPSYKVTFDYASQMDIPRLCRISSVDALPSARLVFRTIGVIIRTKDAYLPSPPATY